MRYIIDNDLHIHSQLSLCSSDPEQTPEKILEYAKENGLKTICLTNHFWDENVEAASDLDYYKIQNFEYISTERPLPQAEGIRFLFGCEAELDKNMTLGLSQERFDEFDFIVVSTTHMHMTGFTIDEKDTSIEKRAALWVKRFEAVLNMDLPFHKVGIAHLPCSSIDDSSRENYIQALNMIKDEDLERLFKKAASLGCGIEINLESKQILEPEVDSVFRIYRIAKQCGCKFYLGSDAHHPARFIEKIPVFEKAIDLLELTEDDKFHI